MSYPGTSVDGVDRTSGRRASAIVVIIVATLLLMWPSIINRGPFFLSDTTNYIRGADAAAFQLFGRTTDWTERYVERYMPAPSKPVSDGFKDTGNRHEPPITLSGRSIYYGTFLYLSDQLAGLRLAVVLQALLSSICIFLTVRRFTSQRRSVAPAFLVASCILALASSLPFFTGYLTPDIFTSLGILAAAHLVIRSAPLQLWEKCFWFALLCASTLTHNSNLLILAIVLAAASVIWLRSRMPSAAGILLIACAIFVGIMGELLFYKSVQLAAGNPPVRPPFVTARLVADGPGKEYLQRSCPQSGFALCNHLQALTGGSDSFLWSVKPQDGVFSVVSNNERRRIANEDFRFAVAVFLDRPGDVIVSSAKSVFSQGRKWHLSEFDMVQDQPAELLAKLPQRVGRELTRTLSYRDNMPLGVSELVSLLTTLIGLALTIRALLRREIESDLKIFLAVLLFGIIADIVVCGALSTPHDRYSMRVLWLIPAAACLTLISQFARNRQMVDRRVKDQARSFDQTPTIGEPGQARLPGSVDSFSPAPALSAAER